MYITRYICRISNFLFPFDTNQFWRLSNFDIADYTVIKLADGRRLNNTLLYICDSCLVFATYESNSGFPAINYKWQMYSSVPEFVCYLPNSFWSAYNNVIMTLASTWYSSPQGAHLIWRDDCNKLSDKGRQLAWYGYVLAQSYLFAISGQTFQTPCNLIHHCVCINIYLVVF